MAELFQKNKSTISRHIKNIFAEGELERDSVVANYATTASDGKTYKVDYYNLDAIISVEYRKYQEKTLSPVEEAYLDTIKSIGKEAKKWK